MCWPTSPPSARRCTRHGPAAAPPAGALHRAAAEVDTRLAGFVAERYTGAHASEVVALTGRMIRRCEAAQLAALARVEATGVWHDDGSRSCAAWAMRTLDLGYGEAHRRVTCATQLGATPTSSASRHRGRSAWPRCCSPRPRPPERPDAGLAVSDAAVGHDLATFRGICRRLRQAGETDEERAARQRRNRRATATIDDEGMFDFRALGPADEGAELQSLFQPWVDDVLRAGWRAGEVARRPRPGGTPCWRWPAPPPNRSPTPTPTPAPPMPHRRSAPPGSPAGAGHG